jgi:MFS family permease
VPAEPARLPGPVKGLAAVSLANDVASEMVYPLLPAFVTTTLGAGPVALGALDGAADLAAAALRWWSGRRADRPGWRGALIGAGYLLATLARPAVAFAAAAWQVVGVRIVDRIGKGLRSPARDAMIADLAPPAVRGRAFGLHRAADHFGAVVGSLVAFALLEAGAPIRAVLGASAVPGLIALIVLAVVLARAGSGAGSESTPEPPPSAARPDPRLVALAVVAAARLPESLILLRLQSRGLSVAAVPLAWAGLHVIRSLASYPAGVATDRLGRAAALSIGTAAYALSLAAMAVDLGRAAGLFAFLVFGLAAGFVEPAERAAVAAVRGVRRGSLFGSYQGQAGLGSLVFGLAYGAVYQRFGPGPALGGAALGSVIGVWVWLALDRSAARPA